ncbi:hypothetical protein JTB14_027062 [Gonioctena quinquepunctata]|nr:hypothetical protein JTB14_027062 [Gonioctena quinquepunctata]
MIQKMSQEVWKRYSSEYLHTLQQRSKWLKPNGPSPTIGPLVLIKDENLPPCKWTLARIITLHSGRDSVNRVATVKTPTGMFKRSLVKLCPLPDLSKELVCPDIL